MSLELNKYISSVIFIDDEFEEVESGIIFFRNKGIWTMYFNPNSLTTDYSYNKFNPTLIFLDLIYQKGDSSPIHAINTLRSFTDDGSPYVLVLWTTHSNLVEETKVQIKTKLNNQPSIILTLDKSSLLSKNNSIFEKELNEQFQKNISAHPLFFNLFNWEKESKLAVGKTFNDILDLSNSRNTTDENLENFLSLLTNGFLNKNKLSTSLSVINTILADNISNRFFETDLDLSSNNTSDFNYKLSINKLLMFEEHKSNRIQPGSLFEKNNDKISESDDIITLFVFDISDVTKCFIDITPSCTFAKEKTSIIVESYIIENLTKDKFRKFKSDKRDNYNYLGTFERNGKAAILVYDCLKIQSFSRDNENYSILYKLRNSLNKDIQIDVNNFLSRLGNNLLRVKTKEYPD